MRRRAHGPVDGPRGPSALTCRSFFPLAEPRSCCCFARGLSRWASSSWARTDSPAARARVCARAAAASRWFHLLSLALTASASRPPPLRSWIWPFRSRSDGSRSRCCCCLSRAPLLALVARMASRVLLELDLASPSARRAQSLRAAVRVALDAVALGRWSGCSRSRCCRALLSTATRSAVDRAPRSARRRRFGVIVGDGSR